MGPRGQHRIAVDGSGERVRYRQGVYMQAPRRCRVRAPRAEKWKEDKKGGTKT